MTKDFHQVFDDLNLISTDALQEMEELQKNDQCKNINKEENPIGYRLAELSKTWAKQWHQRLITIKK